MEILIDDIRGWYSDNMLKLKDSKTEIMVISAKFLPSVHLEHIKNVEFCISPSETVLIMGVIMDFYYIMVSHIFLTIKFKNLFSLLRSGSSPNTKDICKMNHPKLQSMLISLQDLIIAIVCSMVCQKIQSVVNTTVPLVIRTRKFDHITPVLHDFHWLHIESRSKFKVLLGVYMFIWSGPKLFVKRTGFKTKSWPQIRW